MLPSCFNLAGYYPVSFKTRQQSRQVRRRKFGSIQPYTLTLFFLLKFYFSSTLWTYYSIIILFFNY